MHRTVDELKDAITYVEFLDWQAFYEMHPFGAEWDDARMAVLSANIVAALTGKRQSVEAHLAKTRGTVKQSPKKQLMVLQDFVARSKAWQTQQ